MKRFSLALATLYLLGHLQFAHAQSEEESDGEESEEESDDDDTYYYENLQLGGLFPDEIEYEKEPVEFTGSLEPIQTDFELAFCAENLWIIGGRDTLGDPLDSFLILGEETLEVSSVQPTGDAMSARTGHAVANTEFHVYIFGGNDDSAVLGDFLQLDPVNYTLTALALANSPSARKGAAMERWGVSDLLVFGGNDGAQDLNDVHMFDTELQEWSAPITTGDAPSARSGARAAVIDDKLFVYGGEGVTDTDLYCLDLVSYEWNIVDLEEPLDTLTNFDLIPGYFEEEEGDSPVLYLVDHGQVGKVVEINLVDLDWEVVLDHDTLTTSEYGRSVIYEPDEFFTVDFIAGEGLTLNTVAIRGEYPSDDESFFETTAGKIVISAAIGAVAGAIVVLVLLQL